MRLLIYPNEVLTLSTMDYLHPVPQSTIDGMLEITDKYDAVGLAANQVNHGLSVIIVLRRVLVNPRLLEVSPEIIQSKEECLSLPGQQYIVQRHKTILAEWQTPDLKTIHRQLFKGVVATIIQHEIDHLHGKLINDNQRAY